MRPGRTATPPTRPRPARRRVRPPRRPAVGLAALLLLALVAGFFGYVSADPFWLSVGHSTKGTVTVTRCSGTGTWKSCRGDFAAAHGGFIASVTLANRRSEPLHAGDRVPARMVSAQGRAAYIGTASDGLIPSWLFGTLLVLLCGPAIAWVTGAGRLGARQTRLWAYGASVAAPFLLLVWQVALAF
jgi:hypothetical protein